MKILYNLWKLVSSFIYYSYVSIGYMRDSTYSPMKMKLKTLLLNSLLTSLFMANVPITLQLQFNRFVYIEHMLNSDKVGDQMQQAAFSKLSLKIRF